MNLERIHRSIKTAKRTVYMARYPRDGSVPISNEVFESRLSRLKAIQERIKQHGPIQASFDRRTAIREFVAEARERLDLGKTFMALDVERNLDGKLTEVGIALYESGTITTTNLRLHGHERGPSFVFGQTEYATVDEMLARLAQASQQADHYVGHSLHFDFDYLKTLGCVLPKRRYYDTSHWSLLLTGREPNSLSLSETARRLGIDVRDWHCAGNDARYSLDVFLRMCVTV